MATKINTEEIFTSDWVEKVIAMADSGQSRPVFLIEGGTKTPQRVNLSDDGEIYAYEGEGYQYPTVQPDLIYIGYTVQEIKRLRAIAELIAVFDGDAPTQSIWQKVAEAAVKCGLG